MSRRYSESARLLEFALEMGQRVAGSVGEMLPPEAKRHLMNAQREVIQALVVVYEQQAGARRHTRDTRPPDDDPQDFVVRSPRTRRRTAGSGAAKPTPVKPSTRRPPRSTKIEIE